MPDYLLSPPTEATVPITAGCARAFTIENRDTNTGQRIDYPPDAGVTITIDTPTPTILNAVVQAYNAAITIPAAVCDTIRTNTAYRVTLNLGALQTPLLAGRFIRYDG